MPPGRLTASIPADTDPSELTLDEYGHFNGLNYEIYNSNTGVLKTSGVYDGQDHVNVGEDSAGYQRAVTDQDSFKVSPLRPLFPILAARRLQATIAASRNFGRSSRRQYQRLDTGGLLDSQITSLNSGSITDFIGSDLPARYRQPGRLG
jgi:hypothetical protein